MMNTEALTSPSLARDTRNPSASGINTTNPKPERFARRREKKINKSNSQHWMSCGVGREAWGRSEWE